MSSTALTRQLRRAAASIPTNIVEGCGCGSDRDQTRFFQIAMGSAFETEYLLLLTSDLGYLNAEKHKSLTELVSEINAMRRSLLQKLDLRIQKAE